jgi:hypothetical protein
VRSVWETRVSGLLVSRPARWVWLVLAESCARLVLLTLPMDERMEVLVVRVEALWRLAQESAGVERARGSTWHDAKADSARKGGGEVELHEGEADDGRNHDDGATVVEALVACVVSSSPSPSPSRLCSGFTDAPAVPCSYPQGSTPIIIRPHACSSGTGLSGIQPHESLSRGDSGSGSSGVG